MPFNYKWFTIRWGTINERCLLPVFLIKAPKLIYVVLMVFTLVTSSSEDTVTQTSHL